MKRVFIVGCPRSGSTWATYMLSQHARVATFQHAMIFAYLESMQSWHANKAERNFIINPRGENDQAGELEHNYMKLADAVPLDVLNPLLGAVAGGIMDCVGSLREDAAVVVDKTPENGRQAQFILDILPDAHFLHVVRDPRSVFCSHRRASSTWARWQFPTHPIDGARYWREDVEAALRIPDLTPNFHQVRYEDLLQNGPEELGRMMEWLGIGVDEAWCVDALANSSKEKLQPNRSLPADFVRETSKGGWRDELSARDSRLMEYMLADLMERFGYEPSQRAHRSAPLRLSFHDGVRRGLSGLERGARRVTQLAHWRWVGRKLEWPEP
jgi:hypothetical protein